MDKKNHFEVVILGSGFAGIGMAIRLKQSGIDDFVIVERARDVGGVWRDNDYPGCACDVESHLYSFSFAPNPNWSRMFSPQKEIWEYLQNCSKRFDVYSKIRFDHKVVSLKWQSETSLWKIETSQGEFFARSVISATGALSEPKIPEIPGLEDFKGDKFHSSQWNHKVQLKDKRVAVIGTGASAIQFVPEIQPLVGKLLLFQRTPPWVLPRLDRPIRDDERERFSNYPILQKLWRLRIYIIRELYGLTFRHRRFFEYAKKFALHQLHKVVKDPGLRAKLTPGFTIGCKRLLLSNNYYPALIKENVDVITEELRSFRENSIVTQDGVERFVDVVIFGTGFKVTEFVLSDQIYGRAGISMNEHWQGSPRAYLGTTCAGFPNFFFILGPNTGLGHSSVVLMMEPQFELILKTLLYMRKNQVKEIEPRNRVLLRYNHELDFESLKTVWVTGGCKSWYLDKTGRNSTLWPGSIGAFRRRVSRFRPGDYVITKSELYKDSD